MSYLCARVYGTRFASLPLKWGCEKETAQGYSKHRIPLRDYRVKRQNDMLEFAHRAGTSALLCMCISRCSFTSTSTSGTGTALLVRWAKGVK